MFGWELLREPDAALRVETGAANVPRRVTWKTRRKHLPENEVLDFELGLDHTGRPQSHAQNVHLRRHILRRSDAGHVLKETGKSRGERMTHKGERSRRKTRKEH